MGSADAAGNGPEAREHELVETESAEAHFVELAAAEPARAEPQVAEPEPGAEPEAEAGEPGHDLELADEPSGATESPGPGWWLASDGRYYAPELHPDYVALLADDPEPWGLQGSAAASIRSAAEPGGWRDTSGAPPASFTQPGTQRGPEEFFAQPTAPGSAPGRRTRRRPTGRTLLVIVLVVAVLGGGAVAAVAMTGSHLNPKLDRTAALGIEVHLSDLPHGWRSITPTGNSDLGATPTKVKPGLLSAKCTADLNKTVPPAGSFKPDAQTISAFAEGSGDGSPDQQLQSQVTFEPTDSDASRYESDASSALSSFGLGCVRQALVASSDTSGGSTKLRVSRIPAPASAAGLSGFGFSARGTITVRRIRFPVSFAVVLMREGRCVMTLQSSTFAAGPDSGVFDALAQTMATRAEGHS